MASPVIWERLRRAGFVAGAAFLSAAPYVHYVTSVAFPERVQARFRSLSTAELVRFDLASIALVVVIAALVGSLLSERYGFAGLGDRARLRASLRWVLGLGPPVALLSYVFFGRELAARVPGYYPSGLGWAVLLVFKGAIFDEVVARYGMMTIFGGATRKVWAANLLQAIFFTAVGYKSMIFFGLEAGWSAVFAAGILSSFVVHLIQGLLYARFGLIAAALFHLILELKLVLHALLGG